MTVRWKPLLVLSGLFAIIAVVGFAAIAYTLIPRKARDILPVARAERKARQFDKAFIHYKQALQLEGRNAAIHEDMAAMFAEWAAQAPPERQADLRSQELAALAEAANYGKTLKEPRLKLLAAALTRDEVPESLHWAKEVIALDPENADAHFAIATETLEEHAPQLPELKRHLASLEKAKASKVRLAWVKARLAQATGDLTVCRAVLLASRKLTLPPDSGAVDRTALLRLRALDVELTTDPAALPSLVKTLQVECTALMSGPAVAPNRITRLSHVLQGVQTALTATASRAAPSEKPAVNALVDAIEGDVESIFQKSIAAAGKPDLPMSLTYADHLRARGKRDRCLEVVEQTLKSLPPTTAQSTSNEAVMGLHSVAVEASLADTKDKARFEKVAPHINALIASTLPKFQGLGHLFQGAIDLEESGVAGVQKEGATTSQPPPVLPKLRASALTHLKQAAALLPTAVEAQARYGVALILSQDLGLGRQYLQTALRLGNTEPQYQIWAAWSMLQAGYPEEAEPVVKYLMNEMAQGRLTRDLEGTLHLLSGEIHQAARGPEDLKKALVEYEKSYVGKDAPASVQLRMAQIDEQLGQPERALARIEKLRALGQGGAAAEHLSVLILIDQKKEKEARDRLASSRKTFPDSAELIGLEAAILAKDGKPKDADQALARYLVANPENISIVLMRAQVLSDLLDDPKEARNLLVSVAERCDHSAPLVQLALLDLKAKDYAAVTATITKIRSRWKEAAAADLLEAQLALEQGNLSTASIHFDAALKKDPGNKVVQYWKAQIDSRAGASVQAIQAFESLAREGSTKQLDSGLSLAVAARSALANLALERGDVEGAIRRFEGLRVGGNLRGLARNDRWQLVNAYASKGQWPAARKEIASLLNDPESPATNDERVRAANFYRLNNEEPAALAQLNYVLQVDPAQPSAVVTRAYMLADKKQAVEAMALIRNAILKGQDAKKTPVVFYLMLAALENVTPPQADTVKRAMTTLNQGLAVEPLSTELVQAKYRLLLLSEGSKAAVAFVESKQKADDPQETMKRMLAEVYRDRQDYEKAEKTLRELVASWPKEPALAEALLRAMSLQAVRAAEHNDTVRERALNDAIARLIRDFRAKFPNDLNFLQEECELAFRKGDVARAAAVTSEIDKIDKNSPIGPMIRARLYSAQQRDRETVDEYKEALRRDPARQDVRLLLGQASLKIGEADEAVRQAKFVLDADHNSTSAALLEARALARPGTTPQQTAANCEQAVSVLNALIKKQPKLTAAYHQIAEIQLQLNQRDAALKTLRAGVEAVPDDPISLAQLVELLASKNPRTGELDRAQLLSANELAKAVEPRDKAGSLTLALAIGFHKADQLETALAYAEKTVAKFDSPVVRLNYGDILLSLAERAQGDEAKLYFRRALEQYDLVLNAQANSVEAVNNKAWILHTSFGESEKALDLALALLKRVDPSTLPGEFFDTLGAIQEASGKRPEAEESYNKGLRKSPGHPVLNYHMGKLLLAEGQKSAKARPYLEKAFASRQRLTPTMVADLSTLMEKLPVR